MGRHKKIKIESPKKCRYAQCKHDTREIPIGEEVQNGSYYYHKDCYEDKLARARIVDIWKNAIDPNPIYMQLNRAINDVLKNPSVSAQKLEYQLIWCINHGWHMKQPSALHYVAKCEEAAEAYRASNTPKFNDAQFVADEEEKKNDFEYKPQKSGFGKIIK